MRIVQGFSWSLVPSVQVMLVDNVNANNMDCSGLPSNLYMAEWREGRGEIETTDAPGLRTTFTDVSPYAVYFQRFMTVKNTDGALTLAQAQKIQNDLITCLFDDKRQAPYAMTVSGTPYQWSAHDTDVAAMSLESLGGTGTSMFDSLVAQINAMIDEINLNIVNQGNTLVSQIGGLQGNMNSLPIAYLNGYCVGHIITGSTFAASPGVPAASPCPPSVLNFSPPLNVGHIAGASSASIPWSPIGATTPVTLTGSQMAALMAGIATRRQTLLNTRNSKQAAVNALATIPAVIAYTVTTGW